MSRHTNPDLCDCKDADSLVPNRATCAVCGDQKSLRASRANAIISTGSVSVIALIDSVSVPVPASVTGLDSATHWLERNFAQAETVAFYRAERVTDHPTLICGGI